jgi:uncharacterized protein YndB with AHSA1/START domain
MEKLVIEKGVWIAASPARVWQALTTSQQISAWWGDQWDIPTLEKGARVTMLGGDGNNYGATITALKVPERFTLSWDSHQQFPTLAMVTDFTLTEESGGTRLTVRESGFDELPEDIRQQRYEGTLKGYDTVLANLQSFLERENS